MKEQHDSITEAMSRLINLQPFFAVYLRDQMTIVEDESIPVAATDGQKIIINPNAFEKMTVQEREYVLAHEVFHGIFEHLSRMKAYIDRGVGPDMKKFDPEKWNIATDHIINHILDKAGVGTRPQGALEDKTVTADTLADDHYQKVVVPPKPPGGGGGGHGSFDQHMPSKKKVSSQQTKRAVAAARNAAKAQGKLPGDLERMIDGLVEPKHDWKEQLANILTTALGRDASTWARPNRRRLVNPGIYTPGTIGYSTAQVAIVADTSGSISQKELNAFMGELSGILDQAKPQEAKVFWTDSKVAHIDDVDEYTDLTSLKPHGGGGTDMEAAFPIIAEKMDASEVTCVVLTDGYTSTDIANKPTFPVIWVTTSQDDFAYGDSIKLDIE